MKTFINIVKNLNLRPTIFFDIGSRNANECICFLEVFDRCVGFAFECNPVAIEHCEKTIANSSVKNRITLVKKAVWNENIQRKFYPINPEKTITIHKDGNIGASSMFRANGAYDHIEKYIQDEIMVECIRLDNFCETNNIEVVDVIWMDLQGAEYQAFIGLGSYLKKVKIIHTELEINPMYEGQSLFSDVHPFLSNLGFNLIKGNTSAPFGEDFIYVNSRYISK